MVAKKLLTALFLIGFLFSCIAFTGCALPPPDPEAQKAIKDQIVEDRQWRGLEK